MGWFNKTYKEGIKLIVPKLAYCTDNAAMIGSAAYYAYKRGDITDLKLNAISSVKLN